eukprot:TRINITY_DN1537_c0_g2_i1.p1 TRINITY_DN1537_c0_g2~~TRINITY_DN1537_c0_g2_i1.p1  ORF type:complete len:284 (+),score=73.94 TRINITY_DN1537_c0_g2_i1:119-970(+)
MEIVLKGTQGVSLDSIISIRAGNTRRQVPLSHADKPFKFPCKLEECGSIKVDFMHVTATARAVIYAEGEQEFNLKLAPKNGMAQVRELHDSEVSFLVRPAAKTDKTSAGGGLAESQLRESRKKAAAQSTERYLEDHGVLTFLQGLLQGIIKDKPADPYNFVAQQFASAVVHPPEAPKLPPPPGLPKTLETPNNHGLPAKSTYEPEDLSTLDPLSGGPSLQLPSAGISQELDDEPVDNIEQLRQQARIVLLDSAKSGRLRDVLKATAQEKPKQTQPDEIEQLRQ